MSNIFIALCIGVVDGIIDVAPMIIQKLDKFACISAFIGAMTTASFMPDEDHSFFSKLETRAKEIFSHFSNDGYLIVEGETELIIGQPSNLIRCSINDY